MTKPTRIPAPTALDASARGCPFRWRGQCSGTHCNLQADAHGDDARYVQVRRQGLYLAACIVDDVAALGIRDPEVLIDEIRGRICELVRCELNGSSEQ